MQVIVANLREKMGSFGMFAASYSVQLKRTGIMNNIVLFAMDNE
jgi:hypothetical protein